MPAEIMRTECRAWTGPVSVGAVLESLFADDDDDDDAQKTASPPPDAWLRTLRPRMVAVP